jgi:hypothetical protein
VLVMFGSSLLFDFSYFLKPAASTLTV